MQTLSSAIQEGLVDVGSKKSHRKHLWYPRTYLLLCYEKINLLVPLFHKIKKVFSLFKLHSKFPNSDPLYRSLQSITFVPYSLLEINTMSACSYTL